MNEPEKNTILLECMKERNNSIRTIRERVQSLCLWSLGIMLAASGWILQGGITISLPGKVLFSLILISCFLVLRFFYIEDLRKGFKSQQEILIKVEKALKLYDENVFNSDAESLYPECWKNCCKEDGEGRFFQSSEALLYLGAIILLLIIWLNGLTPIILRDAEKPSRNIENVVKHKPHNFFQEGWKYF